MDRKCAILLLTAALRAQSHWPAQLELDVKTQSWEAAVRVGSALTGEIEAGRMFATFAGVPEEKKARELYADALDHTGNRAEAQHQRAIAGRLDDPDSPENSRRLARLKAEVLAVEIEQPAHFPAADRVQIIAFWADWCVLCKPELAELARYSNADAKVVTLDADHLDRALREYAQPDLPQLYVLDRTGRIRFHIAGYDPQLFLRKLDWMVAASQL